jgi:hypothetical protein
MTHVSKVTTEPRFYSRQWLRELLSSNLVQKDSEDEDCCLLGCSTV